MDFIIVLVLKRLIENTDYTNEILSLLTSLYSPRRNTKRKSIGPEKVAFLNHSQKADVNNEKLRLYSRLYATSKTKISI